MITNRATSLLHPKLNVGSGPHSRQPPTSADGPLPTHSGRWGRRNAGGKADIAYQFLANTRFADSAAAVQRLLPLAAGLRTHGLVHLAAVRWRRRQRRHRQVSRHG